MVYFWSEILVYFSVNISTLQGAILPIHNFYYCTPAKVYIAPIKNQGLQEAAKIAEQIRAEFATVFNPYNWSLSKHLEYAGTRGIPITIIIGKRDLQLNKVTIRNMITGEQKLTNIKDVAMETNEMLRDMK